MAGIVFPEKKVKLAMAILAATAVGSLPNAANAAFYGGLGYLASEVEPRVNQSGFQVTDNNSSGAQIFLGADLNQRISVEGYYADLGEADLSDGTAQGDITYRTAGASGLLYVFSTQGSSGLSARQGLLFYGRAGFGYLDNDSDSITFNRVESSHIAAGLGAEYNFRNGFGVRGEFHNLDQDANYVSFSILKRFGSRSGGDSVLAELPQPPVEEKIPEAESVTTPEIKEPVAAVVTPVPVVTPAVVETVNADVDGDGVANEADLCSSSLAGAEVAVNGCVYSGVINDVNFSTNSASLTPAATAALDAAIVEYSTNPSLKIVVQAHTDNRGDARNNMALSRLRAETVVRYLTDVGGVNLGRMSAVGFGESKPIASNQTAEGRFVNRRVEIEIVKGQ